LNKQRPSIYVKSIGDVLKELDACSSGRRGLSNVYGVRAAKAAYERARKAHLDWFIDGVVLPSMYQEIQDGAAKINPSGKRRYPCCEAHNTPAEKGTREFVQNAIEMAKSADELRVIAPWSVVKSFAEKQGAFKRVRTKSLKAAA
jgi:hypothetical protein